MPTDLPEFFSGTGTLGDKEARKAVRKMALKSMRQSLWGIAKGLALHYGVTLAGVAVIAASGFHGVWRSALSATAIGLLARWFLPNQARTMANQVKPTLYGGEPAGVVELTPDQLSDFFAKFGQEGAVDAAPKASPYL